ncbi:MAG: SH3 domain-containing protein [Ruminococcus sp.]|nr:SH3 domain-containing protein [Ruminococcus sp.]
MATGKAEVTTTGLKVRKGAGLSYPVIATLNRGDMIEFTALTGGWYHIRYNGEPAFVFAQYTRLVSEDPDRSEYNVTPVSASYKVMASAVNIRREPSVSGEVLGKLFKDDIIEATGETAGWLIFSYKGETGYVMAEYTKKRSKR